MTAVITGCHMPIGTDSTPSFRSSNTEWATQTCRYQHKCVALLRHASRWWDWEWGTVATTNTYTVRAVASGVEVARGH